METEYHSTNQDILEHYNGIREMILKIENEAPHLEFNLITEDFGEHWNYVRKLIRRLEKLSHRREALKNRVITRSMTRVMSKKKLKSEK